MSPDGGRRRRWRGDRPPLGSDFRRLLAAGTISNLGDGVDQVALPLLAALLTRDPLLFAGVATAQRAPWLLFALQAGALADRLDRRRVMVTANAVRAVVLGLLGVAVLLDAATIGLLIGAAFLLGSMEVLFDTSAQALLPRVVRREQLERANGLQMGAEMVANSFVGPPLGGALFAAAAALPVLLDASTFAVSALLLMTLGSSVGRAVVRPGDAGPVDAVAADPPAVVATTPASPRRPRIRDDVREGYRWLRAEPVLWRLAVLLGLMNGTNMMFGAILVLFALEVLGVGEVALGLLLTATAVGALVGSLVADRLVAWGGRGPVLWTTLLAAVAIPVVQGLTSSPWVFGAAGVGFGFAAVTWNVVTVSLRQTVIPDHLLGRVNAVYRFLGWGAMPVGAALGGVVADALGLRAPFLVGAGLMALGLLYARGTVTSARIEELRARADQEPTA